MRHPARSKCTVTCPATTALSAFTLIELLVVVAIIALLISILLPNLGRAREQARAAVCGQRLRDFGGGLAIYTTENQDWIPGMNTSGFGLRANEQTTNPAVLHRSKQPVQTSDWMTPVLANTQELPAQRAERFKYLFDKYRCPSQRYTSALYRSATTPVIDYADFPKHAPWPAASYKMSIWFQYWGQNNRRPLGRLAHPNPNVNIFLAAEAARPDWEMQVSEYESRITLVGPAARKVFVSDGTRYLESAQQPLDHEVNPVPKFSGDGRLAFGAFSDSGAWWCGSTAFGVALGSKNWYGGTVPRGSSSNGLNLSLSYRHGAPTEGARAAPDNRGQINAAFFDGHVERLGDRESRDVYLWYPSGAKVRTPAEGMTQVPADFVVP